MQIRNLSRVELLGMIANGENSFVEFKRDDVRSDSIVKEMAALLNLKGGYILLGIEDDGRIAGMSRGRKMVEEWIINIAR
ncbi:MAG: ATP-binding protein [Bacteroidetes bacterium]|nr:ATP-binding protein [Bacteroidota bacterium]MCY4206092.1 ATP-binding protein [Bacteroidota bacterium]